MVLVTLKQAQASNARIASTLPAGLVGVFLGGTSGIGEYALIQFAKQTISPRAYFIGRSQEAADRIKHECEKLNPAGQYTFIKADTSLIKNVDDVCEQIKAKEKTINLLFLTQGTLASGTTLLYYGRTRFTLNLLPLVQRATSLRRVISVAVGTKEGEINPNDWERRNMQVMRTRGHAASMLTLSLEKIAEMAPEVSFVHQFPGWVRGGVARDNTGLLWGFIKNVMTPILSPFLMLKDEESGERSLFAATSAIFPAAEKGADGVPLADDVKVSRGIDGQAGSGVYSVDVDASPAAPAAEEVLAKLKKEGVDELLWTHTEEVFNRVTGKMSTA